VYQRLSGLLIRVLFLEASPIPWGGSGKLLTTGDTDLPRNRCVEKVFGYSGMICLVPSPLRQTNPGSLWG
jgi:hypothetical protein